MTTLETVPAAIIGLLSHETRCAVLGVDTAAIDAVSPTLEERAQAAVFFARPHVADPAAWVATRRKIARELRQRLMTEGMTLAHRAAWAADAAYLELVANLMEKM